MNSDWLDIELLEDYLDGKLDPKAMHKIEKQALEDPFIAQALAGLSESPKRTTRSFSLLQKQLYERVARQQVVKKDSVFTWQRLSVAAAAAVMFISVSIIFFMREKENNERLATQPKKIEVNIAPAPEGIDSVKDETYAANVTAKSINIPLPVKTKSKKEVSATEEVQVAANPAQSYAMQKVTTATTIDTAKVNTSDAKNKMTNVHAEIATAAPPVAVPIGGWENLDIYLNKNNKLSVVKSGKFVELSFLINGEGEPSDVKVVKSADKEADDEAIRLIKEGPRWEQPKSPESRVNYTIAF